MKGKNIAAGLLVSVVSVALAIGITYAATTNGRENDRNLTFQQQKTPTKANPVLTGTVAPDDPQITTTPTSTYNCTFPMDIWLQYPDAWRVHSYRLGDRVYTKDEMTDALRRNSDLVHDRLLAQVFVVLLNQQSGADATGVRSSFSQAVEWLVTFPAGSKPSEVDLQKADGLVNELEKFNDGLGGPQPCQYNLSEATPVIMDTLGPQASETLTQAPRIYITWTLSPTPKPDAKKKPKATVAPKPTSKPGPTSTKIGPTPVPIETKPNPPPPQDTATSSPPQPENPTTAATQPPQPATVAPGGFTSTPPVPPTAIRPTSVPPTSAPSTAAPATRVPPTILPAALTYRPTKADGIPFLLTKEQPAACNLSQTFQPLRVYPF